MASFLSFMTKKKILAFTGGAGGEIIMLASQITIFLILKRVDQQCLMKQ